ncbi:hypothetical protein [Sulfurimonas sp. C5]|uniref:hypothetical protein n=1 Tax=Sulfurimonas sp. C5 TaxID=3036947 RepID=UPI002455BC26|nr:hypothetical protein [Sulfurimonas sp. C5]MDH4943696.1 hypothetical protein [Sulfurimonas sp. C5]
MNSSIEESPFEHNSLKVIESLIDMHKDLVFVYHNNKPILFNQASKVFFGVETLKEFAREFGTLENRFVPHDSYFHVSTIDNEHPWQQSIMSIEESDRIISMLDRKIKPHAFSVTVEIPLDGYELIFFNDITSQLIKRIMTENKTNLDSNTQAYNRTYFEHVSPIILTAATFNEKLIGICLVEFEHEEVEFAQSISESIKNQIREDDMLVRWNDKSFLLLFLISSEEDAHSVSQKIRDTLNQFQATHKTRVCMGLKNKHESIEAIISRCENSLTDTQENFISL